MLSTQREDIRLLGSRPLHCGQGPLSRQQARESTEIASLAFCLSGFTLLCSLISSAVNHYVIHPVHISSVEDETVNMDPLTPARLNVEVIII